ncbi:phosphoserine transaminase [Glycomyces buryatensis]|uniref:phosphoserine transaminase n=1 Tax=Glycomyces buryatensis TaxID=2570927 RepID=A0A4S8QAQ0_9ACTN|nr:phosphoserine transaminase [Glycomyces buryatensis]THV41583.1 phosphoserine transaminase [Glycomyces buryatensis]
MTDPITIPADLLPADGRFGSGPSKVPSAAMGALAGMGSSVMGTSHRKSAVKNQVGRLRSGLADLFSLPDGYEVVLGVGGTTAFWEVAVFGLVQDKAQCATFGEFGSKFAKAIKIAPHLADPTIITGEPGSAAHLTAEDGVDVYAAPHNETSTGVAIDVKRVAAPGLMLHDATSAAAGLPVDLNETDCYYFAPQKGLASDGGLWIAIMSPAAIERAEQIAASGRYIPAFLDLKTAIDNSRKDQTYNTPAVATVVLAAEQVDALNAAGGLDAATKRCAESAGTLYSWAASRDFAEPFVTDEKLRSNVVATIDFDGVDAAEIAKVLRANGILDTEPYRKLGRNQLRIATYPAVDPADTAKLTEAIDYVVAQLS